VCRYRLARKHEQAEKHADEAPDLAGDYQATSSEQKQSANGGEARLEMSGPLREAFGIFREVHGGMKKWRSRRGKGKKR
jgi:hypothetical protein